MTRKQVLLRDGWAVVTLIRGKPLTVVVYADRDTADKAAARYPDNRYVLPTTVYASRPLKNVTPRKRLVVQKALPVIDI